MFNVMFSFFSIFLLMIFLFKKAIGFEDVSSDVSNEEEDTRPNYNYSFNESLINPGKKRRFDD